jgi:hypothetical protein
MLSEEHRSELMERTAPCEPLVTSAWRLIIYMVHTEFIQCHMQVVDTLIHASRLVCSDTYVEEMIIVVERLRIHFSVATVARATARTAESTDPSEKVRMIETDCI